MLTLNDLIPENFKKIVEKDPRWKSESRKNPSKRLTIANLFRRKKKKKK